MRSESFAAYTYLRSDTYAMSKLKVILITQRLSYISEYCEERESLDSQWHTLLRDAGYAQLLPISYKQDPVEIFELFEISGVILSGGNDVYHKPDLPKDVVRLLSTKRDSFERAVFREARKNKVPVLGVCRGLQLLASEYQAKLVAVSNHVGSPHSIVQCSNGQTEPSALFNLVNCILFEDDGSPRGELVNSYHNFAPSLLSTIGTQMHVVAVAADVDTVEAFVQSKDQVVAIMWHPERSVELARERDLELIRVVFGLTKSEVRCEPNRVGEQVLPRDHVVILCAGQGTRLRPLTDLIPKCMVKYNGRAIIDYILSVLVHVGLRNITLVTGYKSDVLIRPGVKYVHNHNYKTSNMVESLFCALRCMKNDSQNLIVSYSDIIYNEIAVRELMNADGADVMVVIDTDWLQLWRRRMDDPLSDAETLRIDDNGYISEIGKKPKSYDDIHGQYIGLMKFTAHGVHILKETFKSLDKGKEYDGKTIDHMYMTTLLQIMIDKGVKIQPVFISGGWIEIDCVGDLNVELDVSGIPTTYSGQSFNFGTKAETLEQLRSSKLFSVLPLIYFTFDEWQNERKRYNIVKRCISLASDAPDNRLIVRSSARSEDTKHTSAAGVHDTIKNVGPAHDELTQAVTAVFSSYDTVHGLDQVLIQPMLSNVTACGVLTTTDLQEYMPYFVMVFEEGGGTDAVTSGVGGGVKTVYAVKDREVIDTSQPSWCSRMFQLASQLEELFQSPMIDIEFAVVENNIHILQVRPLVLPQGFVHVPDSEFFDMLCETESSLKRTLEHNEVLDDMMDWNPAEMIGVQPAPLARSLYELLITDEIAMRSRAILGYRDVSHSPLMCTIAGRSFIKASVSFESFIPACVSADLASKLVQYYLSELRKAPEKHDKVEFEIAFTCFEPDLDKRLESLENCGFTSIEREELRNGLLQITNNMFSQVDDDLAMVSLLPTKLKTMKRQRHDDPIERLNRIVSITRDFGTLPFANLARCGFVAVSLLKSLLRSGHLTESDLDNFMESLNTVSKQISQDLNHLKEGSMTKDGFLTQYGHLRPGTYDICTPRYDENFDVYFPLKSQPACASFQRNVERKYSLDDQIQVRITEHLHKSGLLVDCKELLEFCRKSIEGREKAKFIFTYAVSDILAQISDMGESFNIHRFDISFMDIKWFLREQKSNKAHILDNLLCNRKQRRLELRVKLPCTILSLESLYVHKEFVVRPNFVTKKCVRGDVVTEESLFVSSLQGKIIVVKSADPGWDWLFSNNICALITCYGGANSHMAIRAAELSLPAAIGVGKDKFERFASSHTLQIDALSQTITKLR